MGRPLPGVSVRIVSPDDGEELDVEEDGMLLVTGPNGFRQAASFVSVDNPTDGTPRTATYRVTAPGGTWNTADNGNYTISMQAGQVSDTANRNSPGRKSIPRKQ